MLVEQDAACCAPARAESDNLSVAARVCVIPIHMKKQSFWR